MEGPYRDLGGGFVRLMGTEGSRRSPSRINTVEDALHELLRNSFEAGAGNIYVATTLRRRRYRTLTVIDDGRGVPEPFGAFIFEPGVTSRHLDPTPDHGAGLSLYHLKNFSLSAEVLHTSSPTSIRATFDTKTLPERSLQSGSRHSKTNLLATIQNFLLQRPPENRLNIYLAPPARILTTIITQKQNHTIQIREGLGLGNGVDSGPVTAQSVKREAEGIGLEVSIRTAQRILSGRIRGVERVEAPRHEGGSGLGPRRESESSDTVVPPPGLEEISGIRTILQGAARARYLEIGDIEIKAGKRGWVLQIPVYEPEEEYE